MGAISDPLSPASAELRKNAPTMNAVTSIPIRLATRRSCATARMAFPTMVRRIVTSMAIMMITATTNMRISCGLTPTPAIRIMSSPTGDGTTICEGPQIARPRLVSMIPNPMVLITHDMPGLPANGRTASEVEQDPETTDHDYGPERGN